MLLPNNLGVKKIIWKIVIQTLRMVGRKERRRRKDLRGWFVKAFWSDREEG